MEWKNNFSELNLVFNEPIYFALYDDNNKLIPIFEFYMRIPTVKDVYTNIELITIASILNTDTDELQKQFTMIQNIGTHFGLFNALLLFKDHSQEINIYILKLLSALQNLDIPITIADNGIQYKIGGYDLNYSLFNDIQKILLICMGIKKISDYAIDDPQYKAMQKKINKIKKNGSNIKRMGEHNMFETIVVLTYEFGFTLNEIKEMNLFQMNTYLSYVGQSIRYKVSIVSAGNGLSKKVRYITDRSK